MANKIYVGDIGVIFRVNTGIDLTTATKTTLKVKLPDETAVEWTASIYGEKTNGVLEYKSTSGDLSMVGTYRLQAYVELGTGGTDGKFFGETATFTVYNAYK